MQAIRRRRMRYVLLLTSSLCLAMGSVVGFKIGMTVVFGVTVIISLILLAKQNRLLYQANLIWDNPIFLVSSASVLMSPEQATTIVSTFGLWDGSKVHQWGLAGIRGVRLISTDIHKGKVSLSFGNEDETTLAGLMHGITNEQEALDVRERLRRETGVTATIMDW